MLSFCAGPWLWPPAPAQGGVVGIHGLPLISRSTAWIGRLSSGPVKVQTSCAAICSRVRGSVAAAAAPPRFTVAVVPTTDNLIEAPAGNSVLAGDVGLVCVFSHCDCGSFWSAPTRLVTRNVGVVPTGTNTESGTSTCPLGSKKYRSCGL